MPQATFQRGSCQGRAAPLPAVHALRRCKQTGAIIAPVCRSNASAKRTHGETRGVGLAMIARPTPRVSPWVRFALAFDRPTHLPLPEVVAVQRGPLSVWAVRAHPDRGSGGWVGKQG